MWNKLLSIIQDEVSPQIFNTWFIPTRPLSSSPDHIEVGVPTRFFKDYMEDRYKVWLEDRLKVIEGRDVSISFVVIPDEASHTILRENDITSIQREASLISNSSLNPKYGIENFVVGSCNRFAHAACLAVADSPGMAYNPLFIYGGVGLGKTHLLHATGLSVLKKYFSKRVFYVSSEQFTNEFIDSIKYNRLESFKNKYRGIEVLLIDDIQFLAGKESTQEEFFHTFNSLYESSRQIVISSDRPPREIPTIEDRLRSRFECGLITDIQPPDIETRIVILKKMAEREGMVIPDEVINFIAENIKNNIRELEGALLRVFVYASVEGKKIDITLAKEQLRDVLIDEKPLHISIESIQRKVAKQFRLQMSDMVSKRRSSNISFPRQVAMYLSRELTNFSLPEIGEYFGGKDHTTILHAYNKIKERLKEDESLRLVVERLIEELKKPV